ncbi:hypothetical protein BD626DRAFT_526168 [Schizophyllum amplum]|uniref:Uncharacterized protein n=1 Tax=Schizophyllum amplum TaxID=97359 RepID=A0A550BSC9_9AGAR|nr:hypothetical protein BD626DRAFT_526159 [Auriculariopsis ampla]TRM55455.1 hypothetical protein BD626DRAFT_526168 [Auriculariopsis ampla]
MMYYDCYRNPTTCEQNREGKQSEGGGEGEWKGSMVGGHVRGQGRAGMRDTIVAPQGHSFDDPRRRLPLSTSDATHRPCQDAWPLIACLSRRHSLTVTSAASWSRGATTLRGRRGASKAKATSHGWPNGCQWKVRRPRPRQQRQDVVYLEVYGD